MASLVSWLGKKASQAVDQINPLDNGRTWKQRTPTNNRSVVQQVQHSAPANVARPVVDMGRGLASAGYHVATIPAETARTAVAEITGNMAAQNAAIQRAHQGFNAAKGLAQGITSSAYQLGESVNPAGGDVYKRQHTFKNPVAKAVFGDAPIPSMQKQFKDTKATQGIATAASGAVLTSIMDAAGGRAAGKSAAVKSAAPVIAKGAEKASQATAIKPIRQIDQTIKQYQKAYDVETNPTRRAQISKGITELNSQRRSMAEGGYAKIPNGKNDPAPDLHPEQKAFINDYAEMLKGMGQGNGVNILSDGRRVSNNVRSAADKGKALTNQDWFDRARQEIESGKAAYGASDEYATLPQKPLDIPAGFDVPVSTKPAERVSLPATPKSNKVLTDQPQLATRPQIEVPNKAPSLAQPPKGSSANYTTSEQYLQQLNADQKAARAGESSVGKFKSEVKKKLVDRYAPIEDPLVKLRRQGVINAKNDITPKIDRAIRADTLAGQYIKDNGLDKIIQNVPNTKAFDQYVIAKHAADLEAKGIKTGRNPAADAKLVQDLAPQYEPHAQALTQYSQGLLDKATEYGLISKELSASLKQQYPNYVPFNRIFGDGEIQGFKGAGNGKASISSQTVVKKIQGSERQIESPLASLVKKTQDVVSQGERNQAAKTLASYKDLPNNPFGLREIGKNETIGTKNTISFLDNGVKRTFETSAEVAEAAKNLNPVQLGLLGKIFSYPTRLLRLGATGLNPAFALANVAKDTASAFVNSKHPVVASPANPVVFMDGLKAAFWHGSDNYHELIRSGAGGTSFDIAREAQPKNVALIRAQKNAGTKLAYTVTHPNQLFRAAEDAIGRSEEFNRAIQYYGNKRAYLAQGMSEADAARLAAHDARNNTVNFARGGEWTQALNSTLPYLNAGVQGSRILVRNLRERPAQTGTKIAIVGFLPVAATTAWNLKDPQRKAVYDDIPDYEKEGNIIIVPPGAHKDANGRYNVIKIPVSQEIANLNSIVRNGIESALTDKNIDFEAMASNLLGTATSLNTNTSRTLVGQLTPQAIKPLLEATVNQNLFTGNKIIPDKQKNLQPKDQGGDYTSGTAKTLAKSNLVSPFVIDNTIRTATGGLGQNLVHFSDTALAKAGVIKPNEVKGTPVGEAIANRFTSANSKPASTIVDEQTNPLIKKLTSLPEFKSMSADEKAKALNRLTNDAKTTFYQKYDAQNQQGQYSPTFTGKQTNLSQRQAGLLDGSTDVKSYLTTQASGGGSKTKIQSGLSTQASHVLQKQSNMSADERTKLWNSQPAAEYNYKAAQYENNVKAGTVTTAQRIKAENELNKLKIGSTYDKGVRDLYSLSKSALNTYLSTPENGVDKKSIAEQLKSYDQALYDAGQTKYRKFKTGFASAKGKGRKSGKKTARGSKRSRVGKSAAPLAVIRKGNIKVPTVKKMAIKSAPSFKANTRRSFTPKQIGVSGGNSLQKLLNSA